MSRQNRSKTPTTNRPSTQHDKSLLQSSRQPNQTQKFSNYSTKTQSAYTSMYKQSDPSQVKLVKNEGDYYDSAVKLGNIINEYDFIKEHAEECKFDKSVLVKDLSLAVKAGDEDEAFAMEPHLWINFRRGNTLLQIYDPRDYESLVKTIIARKGLNKFFDIAYEYISHDGRYRDDRLSNYEANVKNLALAGSKRAIAEGHKVEVLKTLKANGENTQISYNPDLDTFIIASKNVGLLARDEKDLELYPPKALRYNFAYLMAKCWFTLISEFKKKDLEALKKDMVNRTFIGEYIGNIECQHLVKYPRETIIFYAIVDNNSPKICQLTEDSYKIFKKYGFDMVKVDQIGLYTDYDKMCDDLEKEYVQVSGKSIREEEEGAVLYMIKRHKEDPSKDEILSLSKFKTLEYRLFRKMREKLRNFAQYKTKQSSDQLIEKFIKESKELCRDLPLPHPFEFYVDLCVTAFQLITRGPKKEVLYFTDRLLNEYISFLEDVLFTYEDKNRGNKRKYMGKISFDSLVLDNQAAIHYEGYTGNRYRAVIKAQPNQDQHKPSAVESVKSLGNNIILIVPAFGIETEAVEAIKNEFSQFVESDTYKKEFAEQHSKDQSIINFTMLTSLKGLKDHALSHTDRIYYFMFNYTQQYLNNQLMQRFLSDESNQFYCPKNINSEASIKEYINEELALFDETYKELSMKANFENSLHTEKELLSKIVWAKGRVCPVIVQKKTGTQEVPRQVQIIEPVPVLKKKNDTVPKKKEVEEEKVDLSKKKVTINDIPEYENKTQVQIQNQKYVVKQKPSQTQESSQRTEVAAPTGQKSITVIIPIGIPGMGKTTFIENQLKPYINSLANTRIIVFSSDAIRKKCMDDYIAQNPRSSYDDAFQSTTRKAGDIFFKTLTDKIEEAVTDKTYDNIVICLDKNHPPNSLQRTIDTINKSSQSFLSKGNKFTLTKVAMIPHILQPHGEYPFSLNFLFQCYLRCFDRENHETLSNKDPNNLARVSVSFFKFYQGIKFDEEFLNTNRIDKFLRVPLTLEHKEFELPYNLHVCLDKCLKLSSNSGLPEPNPEFERLVELTTIYKTYFQGLTGQESQIQNVLHCQQKQLFGHQITSHPVQYEQNHKDTIITQTPIASNPPKNQPKSTSQQQQSNLISVVTQPAPKKETEPSLVQMGSFNENLPIQPLIQTPQMSLSEQTPHFGQTQKDNSQQEFKQYRPKQTSQQKQIEQDFEPVRKVTQVKYIPKKGQIPLFLGISLHFDNKLNSKLRKIMLEDITLLLEKYQTAAIRDTLGSLQDIWKSNKKDSNGWVKPNDYHVTTYYVGKDEERTEKPIYKEFQEDQNAAVEILAVILVPGRIVTGICFPEYQPIDNKCPHVTLMHNEWKPNMSNYLLEAACVRDKNAFVTVYEDLKTYGKVQPGDEIKQANVKVDKNGPSSSCYFIALPQPVRFEGVTKVYYS